MDFNLERIKNNVQKATTEDLLDRITVFRSGMEPEAIPVIEEELHSRKVNSDEIEKHRQRREAQLLPSPGIPRECSFCHRPATSRGWAWHWIWNRLPVFPRIFYYCEQHQPQPRPQTGSSIEARDSSPPKDSVPGM